MKLALFQAAGKNDILPGLLTERGVVDIADAVKRSYTPQLTMQGIIDDFDRLRPALEQLAAEGKAVPLDAGAAHAAAAAAGQDPLPASPTTGSTPSARRARSTCS